MLHKFVFDLILRFHKCPKTSESINNNHRMEIYNGMKQWVGESLSKLLTATNIHYREVIK